LFRGIFFFFFFFFFVFFPFFFFFDASVMFWLISLCVLIFAYFFLAKLGRLSPSRIDHLIGYALFPFSLYRPLFPAFLSLLAFTRCHRHAFLLLRSDAFFYFSSVPAFFVRFTPCFPDRVSAPPSAQSTRRVLGLSGQFKGVERSSASPDSLSKFPFGSNLSFGVGPWWMIMALGESRF